MNILHKFLCLLKIHLTVWVNNARVICLFLLLFLIALDVSLPLREVALGNGYTVGPWLIPFVMSNSYYCFILHSGSLLLLCDVPFRSGLSRFYEIRCSRLTLTLSVCVFCFLVIASYFILFQIAITIILLPVLSFSNEWGSVFKLVSNNGCEGLAYTISKPILAYLTPYKGIVYTYVLSILASYTHVLIIYLFDKTILKNFTIILSASTYLAAPILSGFGIYILPIQMAAIENLAGSNAISTPTHSLVILCIIALSLIGLICIKNIGSFGIEEKGRY